MPRRRAGKAANATWAQPLADLVQTVIGPAARRRGFGESNLIMFWDDIAGERLAAHSQPVRVQWPPRPRHALAEEDTAPATLIVRVESGFALELQHLAPSVIERVNAHFGWRCIERLRLVQGPAAVLRQAAKRRAPPPDEAAFLAAEQIVGQTAAEPLRNALTHLGAHIVQGKRPLRGA
ncbi:MAG TPA: DciA family protein [Methylocella sp.]|nr:DciA family protein [Methylocella sp.]